MLNVQGFLELFPYHLIRINQDQFYDPIYKNSKLDSSINTSLHYSAENALEINTKHPVLVNVHLNGNLAKDIKVWDSYIGKLSKAWEKIYYCFVLDFDRKDCKVFESTDSLDYTNKLLSILHPDHIESHNFLEFLRPSFASVWLWWCHLYYMFDETFLGEINNLDIPTILSWVANVYKPLWLDPRPYKHNTPIRMPLSFNWKQWPDHTPHFVQLYNVTKDRTLLEFNHYEYNKTSLSNMMHLDDYCKANKIVSESIKKEYSKKYPQISILNLRTVLERTGRYEISDYGTIKFDWEYTHWYKYYFSPDWKWDYINNFSNHPERPSWPLVPVLVSLFWWSSSAATFIKEQFWLSWGELTNDKELSWNNIYTINIWDDIIELNSHDAWVDIVYWLWDNKWPKTIFKSKINIIWKIEYTWDIRWFETDKTNRAIVVIHKWIKKIIPVESSSKKFNQYCTDIGIPAFVASDITLANFNMLVLECKEIPTIEYLNNSIITDDFISLKGSIIKWAVTDEYYLAWKEDIINTKLTPVSIKEFYKHFSSAFDPTLVAALMCQTIACSYLWSIKDKITPGIFIYWDTWWGKTAIVETLMNMIWYDKSFKYDIGSTTDQPFKMAACDPAPMFIEEVQETQNVLRKQENIRAILNRSTWGRWVGSTNYKYEYKASVIMAWEGYFSSMSVINRLLTIVYRPNMRIDNADAIRWLQSHTACSEVRDYIWQTSWTINDRVNKRADILLKHFKNSRAADTYAPLIEINESLKLCPSEDLIQYCSKLISYTWSAKENAKPEWFKAMLNACIGLATLPNASSYSTVTSDWYDIIMIVGTENINRLKPWIIEAFEWFEDYYSFMKNWFIINIEAWAGNDPTDQKWLLMFKLYNSITNVLKHKMPVTNDYDQGFSSKKWSWSDYSPFEYLKEEWRPSLQDLW